MDNTDENKPKVTVNETSPIVDPTEPTGVKTSWPRMTFFDYGVEHAAAFINGLPDNDPLYKEAVYIGTPRYTLIKRANEEGSNWCQHIKHDDKVIGPQRPRLRSTGGNVAGRAAIEMIRRNNGNGGTLTYTLYHTGINITVEPPKESRLIDLEFALQHQATQVGISTTGLLLNARSGVFSEALIRLALEHVISTNYPCGADEIVDTLLEVIDPLDYGSLVWGVAATKFANGHPWEFQCISDDCKASRTAMINFSRMLWVDKAALTEKQITILANNSKSITDDLLDQYRNEFKHLDSSSVTLNDGTVIKFGRTSLANYIQTAKRWVDELERAYTKAMSNYTTEARRNEYIDGQIQARRMLKYEHLVSEVCIPGEIEGEYMVIDDRETIRDALIEFSTLDENFSLFEEGADVYINDSTIAMVGYANQTCPTCNFTPVTEEAGGPFRSLVPVAIDRILFTLVQRRNMILSAMAKE